MFSYALGGPSLSQSVSTMRVDTEIPYWLPFWREFCWVSQVRVASAVDTACPYRIHIVDRETKPGSQGVDLYTKACLGILTTNLVGLSAPENRVHTNGGVQQRTLLRRVLKRVLETAFEKVLRRVLRIGPSQR